MGQQAWDAAQRGDLATLSRLVREDAGVANWANPRVRTRLCAPPDLPPPPAPPRPPTTASAATRPLRLRRRR